MNALILAGGPLEPSERLKRLAQEAKLVIAADSGLKHASTFNLRPKLVIGDFDSVSKDDLAAFEDVPRRGHPEDKNDLDIELAIHEALQRKASSLKLFGVLGDRLDQSLAALFIAARLRQKGVVLSLHGNRQDVYPLAGTETRHLQLEEGLTFSLLSLVETSTLSLRGAKYALEHFELAFGFGRGVSNKVATSPLRISMHSGLVLLIVEYDHD